MAGKKFESLRFINFSVCSSESMFNRLMLNPQQLKQSFFPYEV